MVGVMRRLIVLLILLGCARAREPEYVIPRDSTGKIARNPKVTQAFRKAYPPPPWCKTDGRYDGKKCEIDHAIPLCAGGEDAVWNLQYQRRDHADVKDRLEARICRWMKQCGVTK